MFGIGANVLSKTSSRASSFMCRCLATQTTGKNIGVIGAGQIGVAVGLHLSKHGHNVTITDLSTKNKAALVAQGATWVESAAEAAEGKDVVITALPAPPQIRQVMEGEGILDLMAPGSCWIDHTSTDSTETKRLSQLCHARGLEKLEAPLTGGLALLQQGQMTCMVGGEKDTLSKYESLLRCYNETVLHMGPVGSGSIVKIISNMLAGAHLVVAAEATMMAKRHGIDLRAYFDGIRASAGNSYVFETEVPLMFNGTFDPGFAVALHCKDLNLGRKLAIDGRIPTEVFGLVEQIYLKAQFKYGDDAGSSIPAKLIEDDVHETNFVAGFEDWTYEIEPVKGGGLCVVHKNIKD